MGVDIKDTQLNCVLNSNLKNTRKDTTWPQSYSTSIQYFLGLMPLPIKVSEKFPYHCQYVHILCSCLSYLVIEHKYTDTDLSLRSQYLPIISGN